MRGEKKREKRRERRKERKEIREGEEREEERKIKGEGRDVRLGFIFNDHFNTV